MPNDRRLPELLNEFLEAFFSMVRSGQIVVTSACSWSKP